MKKKKTSPQEVEIALDLFIRQRKMERSYWSALKAFALFLAKNKVGEAILSASEEDAFRYRQYLVENFSSATASHRIVVLRLMCRALKDKGILKENVFGLVRAPRRTANRVRWNRGLSDDEIEAVVAVIAAQTDISALRDRAIIELLFGHGLRIGEVLSLTMRDYDGCRVLISNTKEGSSMWLDLSDEERSAVANWLSSRGIGSGFLFCSVSKEERVLYQRKTSTQTINARIKVYCKKAEIPPFTSHSGRVSAITRALEMGYSYEDVRAFSRHSSIQMVEAYDRRERRKIRIKRRA